MRRPAIEVSHYSFQGSEIAHIRVGNDGTKRIVPPAGEHYAFDQTIWRRRVEVSVSPTGRSVRVWVDGKEIKP